MAALEYSPASFGYPAGTVAVRLDAVSSMRLKSSLWHNDSYYSNFTLNNQYLIANLSRLYYRYINLSTFLASLSTNLTEVALNCGKTHLCLAAYITISERNVLIVVENS